MLYLYRYLLYKGIRKNEQGIYDKYNVLFNSTNNNFDLLFIGSSRAEMHFNPKVFDSICQTNSYNFGISGAAVKLSYVLLKNYCLHNVKPKHIILNIDYFALDNDSDKITQFPRFFPYLFNTSLRNSLNGIDSRFTSFYFNPFHSLPYTQFDFISNSIHGWLKIPGKYDSLMYKGFQTSISQHFIKDSTITPNFKLITQHNLAFLDSIILFTKKHNIHLIAVTSPIFKSNNEKIALNKKQLEDRLNKICQKNKIPYYNYVDSVDYLNKNLFSDQIHLNLKGSYKLSVQISHLIDNNSSKSSFFNK